MQANNSSKRASNDLIVFYREAQTLGDPQQALSALHEALRCLDARPEPWEVKIFLDR
jgi:hypothetical protein